MRPLTSLSATLAAAMLTLALIGCSSGEAAEPARTPTPTQTEKAPTESAPVDELEDGEAKIEIIGGDPDEDGVTKTGLSYEEYAIAAYSIWYPGKSHDEVVEFVQTNSAGAYMAQMSRQLCGIAVTNPTATLGPSLDDGTQLSEQQLAEFRVLLTENFCPDVQ